MSGEAGADVINDAPAEALATTATAARVEDAACVAPSRAGAVLGRRTPRRILFTHDGDADDPRHDDGLAYWALEARVRVTRQFPVTGKPPFVVRARALYHGARGEAFRGEFEPRTLRTQYKALRETVRRGAYHGVFSPRSLPVTYLGLKSPVVFCERAPIAAAMEHDAALARLAARSRAKAYEQQRIALKRCAGVIYPSDWAAHAAIAHHEASPAKVHVAPFGANVSEPAQEAVARAIAARRSSPVRVAVVGVNWRTPAARLVRDAFQAAWPDGEARLDLINARHAPAVLPDCMVVHRLPSEALARDQALSQLLAEATVVIAPHFAGGYDLTAASAAAWGAPVVGLDQGGVSHIVQHGRTGLLTPAEASPRVLAQALRAVVDDRDQHAAFAHAARAHYVAALRWERFAETVSRAFDAALVNTLQF